MICDFHHPCPSETDMFIQADVIDSDGHHDHNAAANTTQLLVLLDQIKSFYDTESP